MSYTSIILQESNLDRNGLGIEPLCISVILQHLALDWRVPIDQYDEVVEQMNLLLDKQGLTSAEQNLLTMLGTLVMAYEEEHYPDEHFMLYGLDLLRSLMAEAKLQVEDLLPVFETKTAVVDVLHGERLPTPDQIAKLSAFFDLPEPLFTFTDNRAFA